VGGPGGGGQEAGNDYCNLYIHLVIGAAVVLVSYPKVPWWNVNIIIIKYFGVELLMSLLIVKLISHTYYTTVTLNLHV
jgi:hypothetical protein